MLCAGVPEAGVPEAGVPEAGVAEAGVLPELRLFFTSRSRSCCAFFPAPAGKLE